MFVEPTRILHDLAKTFHPSSEESCWCDPVYVSLILHGGGGRSEHTLLTCSRVPVEYVCDMYRLYRDDPACGHDGAMGFLTPITTLQVTRRTDPEEWLTGCFPCVKRFRIGCQSAEKQSLELFLGRPRNSDRYYAVGHDGTLFVSSRTQRTVHLHEETVRMLMKNTTVYCHRPTVNVVDRECLTF